MYRLLPVVLIGALALVGCSGDDGGDGKPTGAKEAWLEGNKSDAELDQVIARLTRQCMEGKGFTVHPDGGMVGGEQWVFNPDEIITENQGMTPTLEEAQKNGYGMDPRGPGPGGEPSEGESEAPTDDPSGDASGLPGGPEEEYDDSFYTKLTDEERDAYYIALEGVNKEKLWEEYYKEMEEKGETDDMKMEEPEYPNHEKVTLPDGTTRQFPTQGCTAEVNTQVFPDGIGVYTEKEYYALDKFSILIWDELREGPDMQALNESWASCMTGRGFDDLESPDDAYEKANELYYGPSQVIESEDGGSATTYVGDPDEFEMPTDEEMDEAKEKEIKLAVAHVECDQESGYSTGQAELMKGALDTYLVDYETELFGWYEYVTAALGTAQGLLKE
ncbi:hypothetical protein Pen01_22600 [Phytomonospora endophytica]|nr:hypothetical protein Pen01_22600 [Phytomonospora endophytica]